VRIKRTHGHESSMSGRIPFDRDIDFAYGEAQQVSPLIRRVVARNPSPFTFHGTGTYIIGRGNVAIVDPGPLDDAHLSALLDAVRGETVSHILITHTHQDHSPLSADLKAAPAARIYAFGAHDETDESQSGDIRLDASGDTGFAPDVTVADGDVIEGSGWRLEGVFTPGHMSNHMSYALQDEKALLCGDHVMAWSTSVIAPPEGNMADYMASLEKVLAREDEIYWPTHGPPVKRPREFVRAYIAHRRMREAAIVRQFDAGIRTIPEIVEKIYAGTDPKLYPAAGMSVLAHMEHLIEQGKVVTDGAPSVTGEYRLKS